MVHARLASDLLAASSELAELEIKDLGIAWLRLGPEPCNLRNGYRLSQNSNSIGWWPLPTAQIFFACHALLLLWWLHSAAVSIDMQVA